MEIYLFKEGVQSGPFDLQQIGGMLAQGQCQTGDPAWHAGLPEWRPLESVLSVVAPPPPPVPKTHAKRYPRSENPELSPLQTRGKVAGFWCIPTGSSFLKLGMPTQHNVEGELVCPTLLSARTYPALTVLAQSTTLVEHFPWLSLYMREEIAANGKQVFTAPGPSRTDAYLRLIRALHEQGWSFVLQNGDTALLGPGTKLHEHAESLQLELSGRQIHEPEHVRLEGIRSMATLSPKGGISDPLPLSEALGKFAH